MKSWIERGVVVLGIALSSAACEPQECVEMRTCCEAIKDRPGVGNACGEIAQSTSDPDTCREVMRTASMMLAEREASVPAVCKVSEP